MGGDELKIEANRWRMFAERIDAILGGGSAMAEELRRQADEMESGHIPGQEPPYIKEKRALRVDPYALKLSREIAAHDFPFYALVMALMRQADTPNLAKLRAIFPETHAYLVHAYNCPRCSNNVGCAAAGTDQEENTGGSNDHKT